MDEDIPTLVVGLIIMLLVGIGIGFLVAYDTGFVLKDETADNICKEIAGEEYIAVKDTSKLRQDRLICEKENKSPIEIKNGVEVRDEENE